MDEQDYVRLMLGELKVQQNQNEEVVRFGPPDLEEPHKIILSYLSYESWRDRRYLITKTGFRKKRLRKHLKYLEKNDYIDHRSKPDEQRVDQYIRRA